MLAMMRIVAPKQEQVQTHLKLIQEAIRTAVERPRKTRKARWEVKLAHLRARKKTLTLRTMGQTAIQAWMRKANACQIPPSMD